MSHSIKRFKRGLGAILMVGAAALAIGAGPASASVHWSDTTHGIKVSGTVNVTKGASTISCTAPTTQEYSLFEGHGAVLKSDPTYGTLNFKCSNTGTLGLYFVLNALSTTSVNVGMETEWALNPWGPYGFSFFNERVANASFTNGSGATPSKLGFVNDLIGLSSAGEEIKMNGNLNVTNSSGGLLTLLP